MATQITAVRMEGGIEHRHIAGCHVLDRGPTPDFSTTKKVSWVIDQIDAGKKFFTRDWQGTVADVVVIKADDGTRYIRTKADNKLSDNLLRLPRYL